MKLLRIEIQIFLIIFQIFLFFSDCTATFENTKKIAFLTASYAQGPRNTNFLLLLLLLLRTLVKNLLVITVFVVLCTLCSFLQTLQNHANFVEFCKICRNLQTL